MSKKEILVTDNLLSLKNEQDLRNEGFEVYRLPKHHIIEDELIEALKGKAGYILGGIETVTEKVIESVDTLQAIVYNSTDYTVYIPAHDAATKRGIAIANCPGSDSSATAEYALTIMLSMVRNVFDVGRTGKFTELMGRSLDELHIGIIGLGRIGRNFALLLKGLGVPRVSYYSRTRQETMETELRIQYRPKDEILSSCDIISIHTPRSAGVVLSEDDLAHISDDGLVINVSYPDAVDLGALVKEIKKGRLRAAFDFPPNNHFNEANTIPPGRFFWSNEYAGYNTTSVLRMIGDMATVSMINLLKKGTDRNLVNPEYRNYRKDSMK